MAQLANPILPPYLYRYRRIPDDIVFEREIDAIEQPYLWCAAYRKLNDPMEGFYEPTGRFQKDSTYRRAVDLILDAKRNFGVCSFSDTHDNELMWTHYGDYAGICVGYAPPSLLSGLPTEFHLVRLAYGGRPPSISAADAQNPDMAARKMLSHKKLNWAYEREWRVLGEQGRVEIDSRRPVRELRLGSRIADRHKRSILNKLKDTKIRIYGMTISGYEHNWERLNPKK
jgi:hypothetical protein